MRTATAIAYYEAIAADETARSAATILLKSEINAIGPWMDMIRQAALAGFVALDEIAMIRDMPDDHEGKKIILDIFAFDNNRQILTYVARHWDRLTLL